MDLVLVLLCGVLPIIQRCIFSFLFFSFASLLLFEAWLIDKEKPAEVEKKLLGAQGWVTAPAVFQKQF